MVYGEMQLKAVSRASTVFTEVDENPEDLSDLNLVKSVEKLKQLNNTLLLENYIFESYLNRVDPELLSGFQQMLEQLSSLPTYSRQVFNASQRRSSHISVLSRRGTDDSVSSSMFRSGSVYKSSSHSDPFARLSTAQKMEMVSREVDELQNKIQKNAEHAAKLSSLLKWRLEAIHLTVGDMWDVNEKLNVLMQQEAKKLSADIFVRFIEECLRNADHQIEKLQFRTKNLEYGYRHACRQLLMKQDLEDSVVLIDYEQLMVEKKLCVLKLEEKKHQVLKMRKTAGRKTFELTTNRGALSQQLKLLLKTEEDIKLKKAALVSLQKECSLLEEEIELLEKKYSKVAVMTKAYKVPDVMEYLNKKIEVNKLNKSINAWQRRNRVQEGLLSSLTHKLCIVNTRDVSMFLK